MVDTLKKRRDFLAAAKSAYQSTPTVVVQLLRRDDENGPRVGFTCTKKLGNAVTRNRIRRRLKEAVRVAISPLLKVGHDYVLIGRAQTESRPFEAIQKDIISAIDRLHSKPTKV